MPVRRTPIHVFLVSLAVTLVIALGYRLLFTPAYQTNDDVGLSFWAEGVAFCDAPTPFLLYSNYLYGQLLVWLNHLAGTINWYRVVAEVIHAVATLATCYAVLRTDFRWRTGWLLGVYLVTFDLLFWQYPQFTVTAFLAAQAGVLLVFQSLATEERPSWVTITVGVTLVLLGGLIRGQSAYLALVLAAPLLGGSLVLRPRPGARRAVAFWLAAGIVLFAAARYHEAVYRRAPGWGEFAEFNRLRAEFNDYGRVTYNEQTRPVFDRVGWSQTDLQMFCMWFYTDEERFSTQKVREIVRAMPAPQQETVRHRVISGLRSLVSTTRCQFMLVAILTSLATIRWDRRRAIWLLSLLAVSLGLVVYMLARMKLPIHVFWPMLGFLQLAMLMAAVTPRPGCEPGRRRRWLEMTALLAFVVFFASEFRRARQESTAFRETNAKFRGALAELASRPNRLYVPWGALLHYELIHPDDNLEDLRHLKLLPIGAGLRTPTTNQRMAEFKISDLYLAICERDDVWLVATRDWVDVYRVYMREHYGIDVVVETERAISLGEFRGRCYAIDLFKLRRPTPSTSPSIRSHR
jgi:hypothetical protein